MDLADRSRLAWVGVGAVCLGVVALFVHAFVGTFVLGLFVYYAARPLQHRLRRYTTDDRAAVATMLLLVVPALSLLAYVAVVAVGELATLVGSEAAASVVDRVAPGSDPVGRLLRDPVAFLADVERLAAVRSSAAAVLAQVGVLSTAVLHLTLALAFAFFCYRDDERLEAWFRREVGGPDSAAYAFLRAIDRDLETVYFGNLLTVLFVTGLAVVVYNAFSLVAPLSLPAPTLLALLTGLATFVPLVVGKLVYLPAAAYLGLRAVETGVSPVVPVVFLVVSFLLLDLVPQSFVRPYVSGRTLHTGLILFSYVLGTALFGWYGLFYGPLLAVVVVQFANVVLPDLLRGRPVDPEPSAVLSVGSDPPDGPAPAVNGDAEGSDPDPADPQSG
ncbi:MAG: AI-2E family transporter [Haloferacaceae archaeon]